MRPIWSLLLLQFVFTVSILPGPCDRRLSVLSEFLNRPTHKTVSQPELRVACGLARNSLNRQARL